MLGLSVLKYRNTGSVKGLLNTIHTLPPHASVLPLKAIFLRILNAVCEMYLSQQGELSIHEAGRNKSTYSGLVYHGGSLIALALDVQIRKQTQNQKNLDDVMKRMYSEFGATGKTYMIDDVVRIVTDIAGEDFEPFFRKYVSGTERLPFAEYFGGAGLGSTCRRGVT